VSISWHSQRESGNRRECLLKHVFGLSHPESDLWEQWNLPSFGGHHTNSEEPTSLALRNEQDLEMKTAAVVAPFHFGLRSAFFSGVIQEYSCFSRKPEIRFLFS
jgi:hypothetical protein